MTERASLSRTGGVTGNDSDCSLGGLANIEFRRVIGRRRRRCDLLAGCRRLWFSRRGRGFRCAALSVYGFHIGDLLGRGSDFVAVNEFRVTGLLGELYGDLFFEKSFTVQS